jgi:hypothetical protein
MSSVVDSRLSGASEVTAIHPTKRPYSWPESRRMINTINRRPMLPLGKYPQLALCGHLGKAPITRRIRMTISMRYIATIP